jgi:glycerol-3-phosphate dehydrogenase
VVDQLAAFLPNNFSECKTSLEPLLGGKYFDQATLCKDLQKKFPKHSGEKIEILAQRYGSYAFEILKEAQNKETYFTLSGGEKFYPEEVEAIAKKEAIHFASDFFFRRSGVGVPGLPEPESLDGILKILAKVKKWTTARLKQEKLQIINRYKIQ